MQSPRTHRLRGESGCALFPTSPASPPRHLSFRLCTSLSSCNCLHLSSEDDSATTTGLVGLAMRSDIARLPKPVRGAAYDSVLALKVAVFQHFRKLDSHSQILLDHSADPRSVRSGAVDNQGEPTILLSDHSSARLRCRLRSDTTLDKVGEGTPCTYLIKAGRQNPNSALRITEFNPIHSCPTSARQERNRSDESVGPVYTRGKLEGLARMLEAEKRRGHQSTQSAQPPEQEGETPTPRLNANGRPIRKATQDADYTSNPPLVRPPTSPATTGASATSSSKRVARDAPVESNRSKPKSRRLSAPASDAASMSRSVPSRKPRSSDPTASRRVTLNSGALGSAPLFSKPPRTGGPSTVFSQATPKQTSLPGTPSTTSRSTHSGPIRLFLATTDLVPTQRDVLARALESAGVREAEDLVKVLFFHDDILKAFGDQLLVGSAESWPADSRFRTVGEALQAVVEGARVEAKLGKSS